MNTAIPRRKKKNTATAVSMENEDAPWSAAQ